MGKNRHTNQVKALKHQTGFGVIGAVIIISIAVSFIIFGLSAVPIYTDHLTVMKIAEDIAASDEIRKKTPRTIKRSISKLFHTNNLRDMVPEEVLQLHKIPGKGLVLEIDYEARRPLVHNMYLVVHFKEESIGLN